MIYQLDQINSGKKNSKKPFSGDFYEISGDQKWSEGSISQGMMTRWVKCHLNGNKKSVQVWQGGKVASMREFKQKCIPMGINS